MFSIASGHKVYLFSLAGSQVPNSAVVVYMLIQYQSQNAGLLSSNSKGGNIHEEKTHVIGLKKPTILWSGNSRWWVFQPKKKSEFLKENLADFVVQQKTYGFPSIFIVY